MYMCLLSATLLWFIDQALLSGTARYIYRTLRNIDRVALHLQERRNRLNSLLNWCKAAPPSEDTFKSTHRTKASLLASQAYIIVTTPFQVNMYIEQITSFVNRVYFIILKCILLFLDILVCLKESFKKIYLFAYVYIYLSSPLLLIKFV